MKNLLLKIEQIKEEGRSPSLEETRELVREANDLLNKPWSKIKRELAELGDADDREHPDLLTLGVKLLMEIRDTKGCVTKETFAGWSIMTKVITGWSDTEKTKLNLSIKQRDELIERIEEVVQNFMTDYELDGIEFKAHISGRFENIETEMHHLKCKRY